MSISKWSVWSVSVVLGGAAFLTCPIVTQAADILSFNMISGWNYPDNGSVVSPQSNGMASTETAGAPGVNVTNWNNVFTDHRFDNLTTGVPTGLDNNQSPGPYGGNWTDAYGQPVDNSGAAQTGMTITWYERGSVGTGGGGTDDVRMFSSDWDNWGRTGDSAGSPTLIGDGPPQVDAQIIITNIPYAQYDVYAYVGGLDDSGNGQGGTFYANGTAKGLSFANVADGTYLEVPTDGAYDDTNSTDYDGTFVHFTGLSGTLTMVADSTTDGGQRMRWAGLQIVEVPEPTSLLLTALGLMGMGFFRRRRNR